MPSGGKQHGLRIDGDRVLPALRVDAYDLAAFKEEFLCLRVELELRTGFFGRFDEFRDEGSAVALRVERAVELELGPVLQLVVGKQLSTKVESFIVTR